MWSAPLWAGSFPEKKNTDPNLDMTSFLNDLDAADNNTKEPNPSNGAEDKTEVVTLVDILIRKEGK